MAIVLGEGLGGVKQAMGWGGSFTGGTFGF